MAHRLRQLIVHDEQLILPLRLTLAQCHPGTLRVVESQPTKYRSGEDGIFNGLLATVEILLRAAKGVGSDKPLLLVDGGVENFNGAVDELIASGLLSRVLAQTQITFSNSLIESWWRVLKHHWLYLNTLDSAKTVEELVAFYVQEHNARLPHAAFRGQTPDEMYWNTGVTVPTELEAARQQARQARAEANRQRTCSACEPVTVNLN